MSCLWEGGRTADLHLRWDSKHIFSWRNFFLFTDRLAHWAERVHIRPLRKKALKKAEQWMLEHFERSDGLGRDLSGDAECDCGAGVPGVLEGRPADDSRDGRV